MLTMFLFLGMLFCRFVLVLFSDHFARIRAQSCVRHCNIAFGGSVRIQFHEKRQHPHSPKCTLGFIQHHLLCMISRNATHTHNAQDSPSRRRSAVTIHYKGVMGKKQYTKGI
ncbi:hypothetical protein CAOG_010241 [Capsaspora owczarzaki ATCC 30864]|uniref:C2H2-type domain-containing protein n=1 Tax=Capsaspora owczarzaki (strain ATCC 30864) TaxID=595528 RepID=A0A0D2WYC0_CAPO3|nr:hypothetical protein CAOG_010241 [Capsaspora owczarzaki ATCC 30864]